MASAATEFGLRAWMPRQRQLHRIIPSRFPPVGVFDDVASPEELDDLYAIEALTNDRLRSELGHLHLLPREDWLTGAGSTPIMAAFTHPSAARFGDGSYGVLYAARDESTAIRETVHHRERFLAATAEPAIRLDMRRYVVDLAQPLLDGRKALKDTPVMDLDDYSAGQALGRRLQAETAWGLFYPSVRRPGGECAAIFRAPALKLPMLQACHYHYYWNGRAIDFIERAEQVL